MCAQLVANSLSFSFGPLPIIHSATFTVSDHDRLGIVAPNGSGKTTLLRLLAGELEPESGTVEAIPSDTTVSLFRQTVDGGLGLGIAEWLTWRSGVDEAQRDFDAAVAAVTEEAAGSADHYDLALARLLALDVATFRERAIMARERVRLADLDDNHRVRDLSGGQRKRLQLAALGLTRGGALLLDEPTNDLDSSGLNYLEELMEEQRQPVVVVSHDRAFLSNIVTGILELDGHDHTVTRYEGGFDAWQTQRETARRHAEQAFAEWSTTKDQLTQRARRERQWSEKGVAADKKKDEPDRNIKMMKIESTEQLAARASKTERAIERHEKERVEKPWVGWDLRLDFATLPTAGAEVARLDGATVQRGAFVLGPVSVVLASRDRVLVQGPNGGGKTTLIDALFGQLELDGGVGHVGAGTIVGTMSQGRHIFGEESLLDAFMSASDLEMAEARSGLAKLGLGIEHIDRTAAQLSPGEQTRAILALFAARGVNTMILDEPTNHLDLEAIEQLEAALEHFPGTVVLITHDRRMIDNVRITRRWFVEHGTLIDRPS